MAHEWFAGVLNASSWHGLESVESLPDADTLIRRGEETGAWPIAVHTSRMATAEGLPVPGAAVVGTYQGGSRIVHGAVGEGYTPLRPEAWRETVRAAVAAGAKPAGAFALRGGSRMLATFEIADRSDGQVKNFLNIVDSLDGSLRHIAGFSSVRVVCANTLASMMAQDGKQCVKLKHTASLHDNVSYLRDAIERGIREGASISGLYEMAAETRLARPDAEALFDALFPVSTEEERKAEPRKAGNRDKARQDAYIAMARPENSAGPTVASLWNAATWLVDRDATGSAKKGRGGDALDSLLFGARGERVSEIRRIVETALTPAWNPS